jgi:hypothetical protein
VYVINDLSYSFYFVGKPKRQALKDDPHKVNKVDQVDQLNQVDTEMLSKQQEDKCPSEFFRVTIYKLLEGRRCIKRWVAVGEVKMRNGKMLSG